MKHILLSLIFLSLSCFAAETLKIERLPLFASMSQLDYKTGKIIPMPKDKKAKIKKGFHIKKIYSLEELDGKTIETDGFGIPLKMEEKVKEFMMVGDAMYCSHVEPPPPSQVIHVKFTKELKGIPLQDFGDITPFKVTGKLKVIRKKSAYGSAGFELEATKVTKQ